MNILGMKSTGDQTSVSVMLGDEINSFLTSHERKDRPNWEFLLSNIGHKKNFNLDASSDALLLEGDPDLRYLREVNETYGSKDFLVLTYAPIASFTEKETILNFSHGYRCPIRTNIQFNLFKLQLEQKFTIRQKLSNY